jgi:hypothetical protein
MRESLIPELQALAANRKLTTGQRAALLDAIEEINLLRASVRNTEALTVQPAEEDLMQAAGLRSFWDGGSDNAAEFEQHCARLIRLSMQAAHNAVLTRLNREAAAFDHQTGKQTPSLWDAIAATLDVAESSSVSSASVLPDLLIELKACESELHECVQYATVEQAPLRAQEIASMQTRLASIRTVLGLADEAVGEILGHDGIAHLAEQLERYEAVRAGLVYIELGPDEIYVCPADRRGEYCKPSSKEFDHTVDLAVGVLRELKAGTRPTLTA